MPIIQVNALSKRYWINHLNPTSHSLKETLSAGCKKALSKFLPSKKIQINTTQNPPKCEEFWALNNISFQAEAGDRIALLGRNGAGKSTLLKIISRITEPTSGSVILRGRVTSLLEVGTGFHPDLTGRENILLNGSIMGMSYRDIKRKFDEIVDFADIEKFLDTPLKRYSSGMYMRLGFAIAAHLDSEILIVDEVLAVGDAKFQEKCLKKMNEMSRQHRTLFFVSHNIHSVLSLCNKGILLDQGTLKTCGPIESCVNTYLENAQNSGFSWTGNAGNHTIRFTSAKLTPPKQKSHFFLVEEKTNLEIDFEILKASPDLIIGFSLLNVHGKAVAYSRLSDRQEFSQLMNQEGRYTISFELDLSLLHPGEYQLRLESEQNHQPLLNEEILLKLSLLSTNTVTKPFSGCEGAVVSLGNRWSSRANK